MEFRERRDLYASPEGGRWEVARDSRGKLCVLYRPTEMFGAPTYAMDIGVFLAQCRGLGPEHQALLQMIREGKLNCDMPLDASPALGGSFRDHAPGVPSRFK